MPNRYERQEFLDGGCPTNAFEEMNVTLPVTVHAYANVGNVLLSCMGPSVVTRNSDDTPGYHGATSKFTISQRLRVDIPVVFGADADIGEEHVYFTSSDSPDPPVENNSCNCCKCITGD